jgi:tetraacyldisaccharide 4'-kinase
VTLAAASAIYGAAARWRRRWYADPSRRKRLHQPVVSVGNLRVGGSGKTPFVEYVARLLAAAGERPAVLSRGYGRRVAEDGVTVVSDPERVLATVDRAGDEPLMLARHLPGIPVLVCADRHQAGALAERRFGATVHVLDDGFQHMTLDRDVDLLLVGADDLDEPLLPAGRLREPLDAAALADALVIPASDREAADALATTLGVPTVFSYVRSLGEPYWIRRPDPMIARDQPVFAVAAIARPERFFDDLRAEGWRLAGTLALRDHHRYVDADLERIVSEALVAQASAILTTEKDASRLEGLDSLDLHDLPFAAVPLTVAVDPAAPFREWLLARIPPRPLTAATPTGGTPTGGTTTGGTTTDGTTTDGTPTGGSPA